MFFGLENLGLTCGNIFYLHMSSTTCRAKPRVSTVLMIRMCLLLALPAFPIRTATWCSITASLHQYSYSKSRRKVEKVQRRKRNITSNITLLAKFNICILSYSQSLYGILFH